MLLEPNKIFFYQGAVGCLFLKVIKKIDKWSRCEVIMSLDLNKIRKIPIKDDYTLEKACGDVLHQYTLDISYLTDRCILIPSETLSENRLRNITEEFIMPVAMTDIEIFSFERTKKINKILKEQLNKILDEKE